MITALIFTGGITPHRLLIQAATWSKFSHVAVELEDGRVLDATLTYGVKTRKKPSNRLGWTTRIPLDFLPEAERRQAMANMFLEAGKPYDVAWIFDFILNQRGRWNDPNAWVCSELVWLGFERFRIKSQARVAPKHIERAARRARTRLTDS